MIDPDAFAVLIADWCLEVQPGQQIMIETTTLAEGAGGRAAPGGARTRRLAAAAALAPRLDADFFRHARDQHLDGVAPIQLAEAEAADASVRIIRAGEHQSAGRYRP